MLVKPLHALNAPAPILVTLEGIVISMRSEQCSNAPSPILVTVLGMVVLPHPTIRVFVAVSIIAFQLSRES